MTLLAAARRGLLVGVVGICLVATTMAPPAYAQLRPSGGIVNSYAVVLRSFNPGFSASKADDMATHVLLLASYYNIDPRLLIAIVGVESGWHASAVSPSGAEGLGQLMPSTAEALSVQSFQAYENLDGTARYLRRLLNKYWRQKPNTRYSLAIAGYNAGPEAVRRYGGIPPYAETKAYVRHVIGLWHRLQGALPRYALSAPKVARVTAHHVSRPPAPSSVADFDRLDTSMLQREGMVDAANQRAADLALGRAEAQALEAEAVDKTHPQRTIGAFFRRLIGKKTSPSP